jgi:hypothetical protein
MDINGGLMDDINGGLMDGWIDRWMVSQSSSFSHKLLMSSHQSTRADHSIIRYKSFPLFECPLESIVTAAVIPWATTVKEEVLMVMSWL